MSVVCPECDNEYDTRKGLTIHWGHPQSSCSYPDLTEQERGIMVGMILSGGGFDGAGTKHLRKVSVKRQALEWINQRLGMWSGAIADHEEGQDKIILGDETTTQDNWRLTTRTHPWITESQNKNITELSPTTLSFRILYSFRGQTVDESQIYFRHRDRSLVYLLEDNGFYVREVESSNREYSKIYLTSDSSREFYDMIESPIPGFEHKETTFRERHAHKDR